MGKKLSVVLPSYNEEQMIEKTAKVVGDILSREQIPYELVFVNDGSKDHTWDKILKIKEEDSCIKGYVFQGILEKNPQYLLGLSRQMEIVSQLWTAISSIRQKYWLRCTDYGKMAFK